MDFEFVTKIHIKPLWYFCASLKPIQEYGEVQGDPLAHPYGPLGMIPQPDLGGGCVLHRVRVDKHRERAPPDREPRHESPELRRRD